MKRKLVFAALAVALVPVQVASAATGVLRGEVINSTCYGPCIEGQDYPPYTGDGLRVGVRTPDGEPVAVRHPTDGRFRFRLAPGAYRVRAGIESTADPAGFDCWQGEVQRVRVRAGEATSIELHVTNACIV